MTDTPHSSIDPNGLRTVGGATFVRTPLAAARIGLAEATLAKLRSIGGGPPFCKLGRSVVYRVADLDEWVMRRRRDFTAEAR